MSNITYDQMVLGSGLEMPGFLPESFAKSLYLACGGKLRECENDVWTVDIDSLCFIIRPRAHGCAVKVIVTHAPEDFKTYYAKYELAYHFINQAHHAGMTLWERP